MIGCYVLLGTELSDVTIKGFRNRRRQVILGKNFNVDLVNLLERLISGRFRTGSIFQNNRKNGGRLPEKTDPEYYQCYYLTFFQGEGNGPERLVVGKWGEVYYTADHYENFILISHPYNPKLGPYEKNITYLNLLLTQERRLKSAF